MQSPANFGDPPNPQEIRVAIAVLFGHPCKVIAQELRMGLATVEGHRYRLYRKYGVHSAGELAAILMRQPLSEAAE